MPFVDLVVAHMIKQAQMDIDEHACVEFAGDIYCASDIFCGKVLEDKSYLDPEAIEVEYIDQIEHIEAFGL